MNLKQLFKRAIDRNLADKSAILESVLRSEEIKQEVIQVKPMIRKWTRAAMAAALSCVLLASGIAVSATINAGKTATVTLTSNSANVFPGDDVTVTAALSNKEALKKGVVGFTMDVSYDSDRLTYTNETVTNLLGANFDVSAYSSVPGTVTMLVYPKSKDTDNMMFGADVGNLFSLNFKVKDALTLNGNTAGVSPSIHNISPIGTCDFADYQDTGEGFELISVTAQPTSNITVQSYMSGDADNNNVVDLQDLVMVRNDLLQITPLSGSYKGAADLYGEGKITLNSLVGLMTIVAEN